MEGYDEGDVQLVRDLAQRCKEYSNALIMSNMEIERKFKDDIDDLTEQVFEMRG